MSELSQVECIDGGPTDKAAAESRAIHLRELRRIIRETKPKPPKTMEHLPVLQHGWLLPYLLATDDFLWRRWNHWYETTLAQEVIAPIPRIEWKKDDAGFKMLDRSLSVVTNDGDWPGWSGWGAFDYFINWLLFAFGHTGQRELPGEGDEYQGASHRLYQVFNLETLLAYPHDYLGDILAENRHGRHLGFFPTPMCVCELMAHMNLGHEDSRTKSVYDPCVGTGRMLLSASNYSNRLYGSDINPTVIKATLINGFLYAPWLVSPFRFLNQRLSDPLQTQTVKDPISVETGLQVTAHSVLEQSGFEPIKTKRDEGGFVSEQGVLFDV